MEGFALYAVIGLLLLAPLEVFFLIIAAALTRQKGLLPKLAVPSPREQERYGWEELLKLSPERKPSGSRKAIISVIVILLLVVIVAAPGLFLVAPSLHLNLSGQSANDSAILPPVELNETPAKGIFSNMTLPRLNITVPDINLSMVFAPLKANVKAVALGLAVVLAALVVLFFIIRNRKLAVVNKAGETSKKLIRNAAAEKKVKETPKAGSSLFSGLGKIRNYLVPAIILFLLIVVAFLAYILRGRVSNVFAGRLLPFAVSVKEFAMNYRFYMLAGAVILVVLIFLLRHLAKRQQGAGVIPPPTS